MVGRLSRSQLAQIRATPKLQSSPVPAPSFGWNTEDNVAVLDPRYAILMDNWFPMIGGARVRYGSSEIANTIGSQAAVEAISGYHSGATKEFICAENGKIFQVTLGGTVTQKATGLTSDDWLFHQFKGVLFMMNGADSPRDWNGTTLSVTAWTGTGLTVTDLRGCTSFAQRVIAWENTGLQLWYGAAGAITGPMTKFDLSTIVQRGGNIICAKPISRDSGQGIDDLLAIFMDTGEVVIYQGTDPSDSLKWFKIGNFFGEKITDPRAILSRDGDLFVQTQADYVKVSDLLGKEDRPPSRIASAMQEAWSIGSAQSGWQAVKCSDLGIAIFNVPKSDGTFDQHVQNLVTQAWCRYTGLDARSWCELDGKVYFGTSDGRIVRAETGNTDEAGEIIATARTAWNDLGYPGLKGARRMRSILESQGTINYSIALNFDFENDSASLPISLSSAGTPWGSPWGSPWSAAQTIDRRWKGARGSGEFLSLEVKVNALQKITWRRSDVEFEISRQ